MGARYFVLYEAGTACRYRVVWFQADISKRGRDRLPAILIDAIIVTATIFIGLFVGRLLKMDRDLALLTSTGSAICGAAAVLGAEPVVKSEPHKTAVLSRRSLFSELCQCLSIRPYTVQAYWT